MKTLFFFLCFPLFLSAQDSLSLDQRILMGIGTYRAELLKRHPEDVAALKKLTLKLDSLGVTKEQQEGLFFHLNYALSIGSFRNFHRKSVKKRIDRHLKKSGIPFLLSIKDLEGIQKNTAIIDLINLGVLEGSPPFKIRQTSSLYQELEFYQLADRQVIGEIGAGNGSFSLLMCILYFDIRLHINEIYARELNYIKNSFLHCKSIYPRNYYQLSLGRTGTSDFENFRIDKIIIRNSFHHFSKKEKMLTSIKASLTPDGELYIKETLRSSAAASEDVFDCKKKMEKEEILQWFSENGFTLLDEYQKDHTIYLKFKKSK